MRRETENPDFPGLLYPLLYLWLRSIDGTSGQQVNSTTQQWDILAILNLSVIVPLAIEP